MDLSILWNLFCLVTACFQTQMHCSFYRTACNMVCSTFGLQGATFLFPFLLMFPNCFECFHCTHLLHIGIAFVSPLAQQRVIETEQNKEKKIKRTSFLTITG